MKDILVSIFSSFASYCLLSNLCHMQTSSDLNTISYINNISQCVVLYHMVSFWKHFEVLLIYEQKTGRKQCYFFRFFFLLTMNIFNKGIFQNLWTYQLVEVFSFELYTTNWNSNTTILFFVFHLPLKVWSIAEFSCDRNSLKLLFYQN